MGVLDDAIREHLELKKRRGATDDEIARDEAEALGPARREPAPEPVADTDLEDAVEAPPATVAEEPTAVEPPPPPPPPPPIVEEPLADEPVAIDEPIAYEEPPAEPAALDEPPPRRGAAPAADDTPIDFGSPAAFDEPTRVQPPPDRLDEPTAEHAALPVDDVLEADSVPADEQLVDLPPPPPGETAEHDSLADLADDAADEDGLVGDVPRHREPGDEDLPPLNPDRSMIDDPHQPPPPAIPPDARVEVAPVDDGLPGAPPVYDDPPAAEPPVRGDRRPTADDDLLEETPDFLQETPEHDRLWFEQKPPRDFDFDD